MFLLVGFHGIQSFRFRLHVFELPHFHCLRVTEVPKVGRPVHLVEHAPVIRTLIAAVVSSAPERTAERPPTAMLSHRLHLLALQAKSAQPAVILARPAWPPVRPGPGEQGDGAGGRAWWLWGAEGTTAAISVSITPVCSTRWIGRPTFITSVTCIPGIEATNQEDSCSWTKKKKKKIDVVRVLWFQFMFLFNYMQKRSSLYISVLI